MRAPPGRCPSSRWPRGAAERERAVSAGARGCGAVRGGSRKLRPKPSVVSGEIQYRPATGRTVHYSCKRCAPRGRVHGG
eukprot:1829534-Prymnesium_polylepis.2